MTTQIQRRRGTTSEHSTFTGAVGEITVDTTKDTVVVHDGSTTGGHPLAKENNPTFTGNVGIGTTSPSELLTLDSTSAATNDNYIRINSANNTEAGIKFYADLSATKGYTTGYEGNGNLFFIRSDNGGTVTDRLVIDDSGNVGIDNNSPQGNLHVGSAIGYLDSGENTIFANNGSHQRVVIAGGSTHVKDIQFRTTTDATNKGIIRYDANDAMRFYTNGDERLRIDSSGNVGIGTSSPGRTLHVNSTYFNPVRIQSSQTSSRIEFQDSGTDSHDTVSIGSNGNDFQINTSTAGGGIRRVTVTADGNVGIGTPGFTNLGAINAPALGLYASGGARLGIFGNGGRWWYANAETVSSFTIGYRSSGGTVDNSVITALTSGNVGIGTTSPSKLLNIKSSSQYDGFLLSNASSSVAEIVGFSGTNDNGGIVLRNSGTTGVQILASGSSYLNGGNVGIGTPSPTNWLHIFDNTDANDKPSLKIEAYRPAIRLQDRSTLAASAEIVGDNSLIFRISQPVDDTTALTERARIDSSGRLLVGTSSSNQTSGGEQPFAQVASTDSRGGLSLIRYSNNANGSGLYIGKSRGATVGANGAVANNDELGRITFSGNDGTDTNTIAARIQAYVDGTPGTNDMPGRLVFSTTADGASAPTERLRISSDGRIGINAAANDYQNFGINGTTTQTDGNSTEVISVRPNINTAATTVVSFKSRLLTNSGTSITNLSHFNADPSTFSGTVANQFGFNVGSSLTGATNNYGFYSNIASGTNRWNFYAPGNASNYFAGNVLFGTNDASKILDGSLNGKLIGASGVLYSSRNTGTEITHVAFHNSTGGTTAVGTIKTTGLSTAYNTSSDYRLKENVTPMVGAADRVKALKPCRFNFIADATKTVDGFIAHEAQEVVPEAVTGTKDAMEDIGTLTEWDGTILETDTPEPDSLTWDETITDEDGNETVETRTRTWVKTGDRPVMQGIDQAKLVPLLTGALQEALAEIDALKQRLTAAGL